MEKFLIAAFYVLQTLVSCALKCAGFISLDWTALLLIPALFAIGYELIFLVTSGELVFYFTKLYNKYIKNKFAHKA